MRKEIKPRVLCDCCGNVKEYEVYEEFCDQCGNQLNTKTTYPLRMTIWTEEGTSNNYDVECCSWKCVRAYLIANQEKLKAISFISLPYPVGPERDQNDSRRYPDLIDSFFKDFLCVESAQKDGAGQ